jgi:septum site-determining protein MinD
MSNAKTIGVIAIKGGVGKTTATSNLGAVLSTEFGKKVLVVDANFSAPNLGLHLGLINPKKTIHHVMADKIAIEKALYQHFNGFHIIPGSQISGKINPFKLKEKLEKLKGCYDFIVIDSSPALNEEILSTMVASDELLVVSSPDYPTLSMTMRAVRAAKEKKTPIRGIILNKVRGKKFELTKEEIEEATGVPVLGVLPDDVKVLEALSETAPAALYKPNRKVSKEYVKLAAQIIGEDYKEKNVLSKLKGFIAYDIERTRKLVSKVFKREEKRKEDNI